MKAVPIKAALALSATLIATPSLGQPAPASPFPPDVCQRLAAFVQERGGRIDDPLATPITLDEVNRYMRENNIRACRSAVSIMHTKGVKVPPSLLETIGGPQQ